MSVPTAPYQTPTVCAFLKVFPNGDDKGSIVPDRVCSARPGSLRQMSKKKISECLEEREHIESCQAGFEPAFAYEETRTIAHRCTDVNYKTKDG